MLWKLVLVSTKLKFSGTNQYRANIMILLNLHLFYLKVWPIKKLNKKRLVQPGRNLQNHKIKGTQC
jgi:hypothetical protein